MENRFISDRVIRYWAMRFVPLFTITMSVFSGLQAQDFPSFTRYQINTIGAHMGQTDLADMDKDGDMDIVSGQAWYENVTGSGTEWIEHKNLDLGEEQKYGIGVRTWVGDINRDGAVDVVQSEADHPDGRVAWFENDGKGNWTRHMIKDKGTGQDFHSLIVADFDLEGDWDICSGGGPLSQQPQKVYIWENLLEGSSDPPQWRERLLADIPCHEAVGADVDGDGDIDICTKPWTTGKAHYYLGNQLHTVDK